MIRLAILLIWTAGVAVAQDFNARATVIEAQAKRDALTLTLSQPIPWRVFVDDDPWRLVIDTSEVDWTTLNADLLTSLGQARSGRIRAGWSRLVVVLPGPRRIDRAWMETGQDATIRIALAAGADPTGPLSPQEWDAAPIPCPLPHGPARPAIGPW